MWGAIVGIAAASVALAVLHQTLEATGHKERPHKPGQLPEPGPGFEKKAGKFLPAGFRQQLMLPLLLLVSCIKLQYVCFNVHVKVVLYRPCGCQLM